MKKIVVGLAMMVVCVACVAMVPQRTVQLPDFSEITIENSSPDWGLYSVVGFDVWGNMMIDDIQTTTIITQRLDELSVLAKEHKAIQQFRMECLGVYRQAKQSQNNINEIIQNSSFATAPQELKTEGQAVRQLINQFVTAMDTHKEFIEYK